MRLGLLLVLGAVACGGRESGGSAGQSSTASTAASSVVTGGSSTTSSSGGPLPACLVGPASPINVDGVECFPGGPLKGACTDGTPACTYCAIPILCSPTFGPRSFYACSCVGGSWSCTPLLPDGSVCVPHEAGAPDALAPDAADDGPVDAAVDAPVATDGAVCGAGEIVCRTGECGTNVTGCYSGDACPPDPCTMR
jgi:hypothetical protein